MNTPPAAPAGTGPRLWAGLLVWAAAAALMVALDGHAELAQLALVPVLAAAVAALWLPLVPGLAAALLAVVGFNVAFVPPRGSFEVDLRAHWLLLLTLGVVSTVVTLLMDRQRRLAAAERAHAQRAQALLQLVERLRDADDPLQAAPVFFELLGRLSDTPVAASALLLAPAAEPSNPTAPHSPTGPDACTLLGTADADERTGLWLCLTRSQAMGPGTGRHEEQPAWYLPLRSLGSGRGASLGAALLRQPQAQRGTPAEAAAAREHAQALCDQFGLALARARAQAAAAAAAEQARAQQWRNTLLAGISHDFRTPLATVLGAASSLQAQDERLAPAQRQRLAARIVDEVGHLTRLTQNTLQLARLGEAGRGLPAGWLAWESVEELAGSVAQRLRQQHPGLALKLRVEPGLPLLRCSAELLVQLLDNLVLNALTHGRGAGAEAPAEVELQAHREGAGSDAPALVLAVRDRGPGVPPAERERIFQAFERGTAPAAPHGAAAEETPSRRGAGIGLALCRAIAQAHGGTLRYRARAHGGASFECVLPLPPAPALPAEAGAKKGPAP